MISFDHYLKCRKIEASADLLALYLAEAAAMTVDQAKQQIMGILANIGMTDAATANAKLAFLDQLMKQGAQALPQLANLYKQEYPKLKQFQQQQPQQAAQPQQQQPQQQAG